MLLRFSTLGLLTAVAIVTACGGDASDMEYKPGAPTYPEEDTGASSTRGDLPTLPESSILPLLPSDGGIEDAAADDGDARARADANADATLDAP